MQKTSQLSMIPATKAGHFRAKHRAVWSLGVMLFLILASITIGIGTGASTTAPATTPASAPATAQTANPTAVLLAQQFQTTIKPFIQQNCYECHGNGKHIGDMSLDPYTDFKSVQIGRERWIHISQMLKQKLMPPEESKQPAQQQRDAVISWIDQAVNFCDCTGPRDPGRVAIHRLNRNEYNNTIRDLLGVKFQPANDFPVDDSGYGFDNIADVLSMSPLLAEKYLNAAEQATYELLNPENPIKTKLVRFEENQIIANGDRNTPRALNSEGGLKIKYEFPAKGQYEIRIEGYQNKLGTEDARLDMLLDANKLGPIPIKAVKDKPAIMSVKFNAEAGNQTIVLNFGNPYTEKAVAPAPATAPATRPTTRPTTRPATRPAQPPQPPKQNPNQNPPANRGIRLSYIEVEGPLNPPPPPPTPGYAKIFFVKPGAGVTEDAAASSVLQRFASRAFRRPVEADELGGIFKVYKAARTDGDSWEQGVRAGMQAVLCSPKFLFRIEIDPPAARADIKDPKPYVISDYELASRLSYFLWSSMPDDDLIAIAATGKLRDPATLQTQIARMMKDPKSVALVQNFPGQWLELRNLKEFSPDTKIFTTWDDNLRDSMAKETELFFANIVKEDRSILELLNADYSFINERLAKHYGINGVQGNDFRKVSLTGTKRGGLLTQASILTVTAMPTRTSPVKRGKFIMSNVLGIEIPPPPPDVPALSEAPADISKASLRERLEIHRKNPNCAVCHIAMDNIGFSLENFDSIGRFRDRDGNFAIDSLGKMPDGTMLNGADGLRKMVTSRQDEFARTLTKKLLTYALGRGLEYYDDCSVKDIEAVVRKNNYKFSSLIQAIVESEPFQKRRMLRPEEMNIMSERSHENDDDNKEKPKK